MKEPQSGRGGAAMSYCPSGPPESRHRDIWISGKVGGTHTRCLATSLHQKGYEAGYESVIVVGGWSLNDFHLRCLGFL